MKTENKFLLVTLSWCAFVALMLVLFCSCGNCKNNDAGGINDRYLHYPGDFVGHIILDKTKKDGLFSEDYFIIKEISTGSIKKANLIEGFYNVYQIGDTIK